MACKKALEILPDCVCSSAKNLSDVEEASSLIRTAVMSKQYGNEDFLSKLIAQACGKFAVCLFVCFKHKQSVTLSVFSLTDVLFLFVVLVKSDPPPLHVLNSLMHFQQE